MQCAVQQHEPLFINHVVLCELTWILTAVYDHSKCDLIEMIDSILATEYLEFENRETIQSAVEDYKRSKADFADCLIGRRNIALGCESTLTFDRNVRTLETFQIL